MSLESCIRELEEILAAREQLGSSHDMPFALFRYDPESELELRREVRLLETRLQSKGLHVEVVDLGTLMWECFSEHPLGEEGIFESERNARSVDHLLREARGLLAGTGGSRPGPLEQKVIDRLGPLNEDSDVAFLVRAGELFPFYRTSALLERLMREVTVRTVLFYPGVREGASELSFMGAAEPSPNYRPRIFC